MPKEDQVHSPVQYYTLAHLHDHPVQTASDHDPVLSQYWHALFQQPIAAIKFWLHYFPTKL